MQLQLRDKQARVRRAAQKGLAAAYAAHVMRSTGGSPAPLSEALDALPSALLLAAAVEAQVGGADAAAARMAGMALLEGALTPRTISSAAAATAWLRAYLAAGASDKPFSLAAVPVEGSDAAAKAEAKAGVKAPKPAAPKPGEGSSTVSRAPAPAETAALLNAVPAFAAYGPLFKSSAPVLLTEEETEYKVAATKHVFGGHIVFQFACQNTIKEQVLAETDPPAEFLRSTLRSAEQRRRFH
jgi:hypothetical protein